MVSIFAIWTADGLFGWLLSYFFFFVWLVSRFWLVGWFWLILMLVGCSLDHTTVISLVGFTEHKSSSLITMTGSPGGSGHRKFETLLIVWGHWTVTNAPTHTIFHNFIEKWYVTISELTNCWYSLLFWYDSSLKKDSINFCPGMYE